MLNLTQEEFVNLVTLDIHNNLINFAVYALGMVCYSVMIFYFYKNLARKERYDLNPWKPISPHPFFHALKEFLDFLINSLFVFPIVSFIWFLILGGFLIFLSKSQDIAHTLLMSMTVIGSARITAYFSEDLSKDVAKLVPFALLGVFVVDPTFFSIEETVAKFYSVPNYLHLIVQYLIFIVVIEFILRIIHRFVLLVNKEPV